MKYFFKLLFILTITSIFTACKKDPAIVTPKLMPISADTTWVLDSSVNLDRKILLNSCVFESKLYLLGDDYFITIDSSTHTTSSTLIASNGQNLGVYSQPVITPLVYAYLSTDDSSVVVGLNEHPNISVSVNVINSDTNIYTIAVSGDLNEAGPIIAINNLNQLLVPVELTTKSDSVMYLAFALYDITANTGSTSLSVSFNRIIVNRMDSVQMPLQIYRIQAVGDDFYFTSSDNFVTYKIDPLGNFTKIFEGNENIFFLSINDTLNGIGAPLYGDPLKWYINNPGTNLWTGYSINASPSLTGCTTIQNKIIAYSLGQIWEFSFNKSTPEVTIKELDNSNISDTYITSIITFDNRVYVTTINGLYSKPLSKFFKYK